MKFTYSPLVGTSRDWMRFRKGGMGQIGLDESYKTYKTYKSFMPHPAFPVLFCQA